jgi:hypothetical protein
MTRLVGGTLFLLAILTGCASTQPSGAAGERRAAPGKCSACHLPPAEHSLGADRWERYLKNHKRRLRLTEEEKTFLYDFLVGGLPPAAANREGTENGGSTK